MGRSRVIVASVTGHLIGPVGPRVRAAAVLPRYSSSASLPRQIPRLGLYPTGRVYARRKGFGRLFLSKRLLDYVAPLARAAREDAGLTQAEIAERAGVSHATISRFEGGHWPSGQNVEGIVDAYVTVLGLSRVDELAKVVERWMRDEYGDV